MEIIVKKISENEFHAMQIVSWPIWCKEIGEFEWFYDESESCYILEGEVTVTPKNGQPVTFTAGDFVQFPQGLHCVWNVKKPVKKQYRFG